MSAGVSCSCCVFARHGDVLFSVAVGVNYNTGADNKWKRLQMRSRGAGYLSETSYSRYRIEVAQSAG